MSLNTLSGVLPTRPVPREQTQALLDLRSAAAGLIKTFTHWPTALNSRRKSRANNRS